MEHFTSGRMHDMPENATHHTPRCSDLPEQAAPLLLLSDKAASPSAPSAIAVKDHPQTVELNESSLLAMLMDNDDMDALEPGEKDLKLYLMLC